MNKFIRVCLIFTGFLYLAYVAGAWIFLNTSVFTKVAGMENEEQTYVKLHGGYSLFPGFLSVRHAKVYISDQNVSISIDVERAHARFSLKPFLDKKIQIDELHIKEAKVDIGMKSEKESTEFQKKYVTPETMDLKEKAALVEEWTHNHISLNFAHIQIDTISEIKSSLGDFHGNVALTGGFLIQPKVHVEVYPTTLKFYSGEIKDQLSKVEGEILVNIERFRMIDAPGNAIFPYFNADLKIDAGMRSLKLLDMTLRKLPGYAFEGEETRFSIRTQVIKGVLQVGSQVVTTPSILSIHTPSLTASGLGKVLWEVDSKNTSKLVTQIDNVRIKQNSEAVMTGTLKSILLTGKLFGNELLDAFHGVLMTLTMDTIHWNLKSAGKNPNLKYDGVISGGGTLTGFSGDIPEKTRERKLTSSLKLNIDQLNLRTSFLSDLQGQGGIEVKALPIDLSESSILFPDVGVDLNLKVGKYGIVKTHASFKNLEHHYFPDDSWKGQLAWKFDKTAPFVDLLRDQDKLSAVLGTVARVDNLVVKIDCEVGDKYSWLRFNEVSSSGIWKAFGSLINQEDGIRGVFETKVIGLPVGIRIQPDHTDVKFLPSAEWYDEAPRGLPPQVQ